MYLYLIYGRCIRCGKELRKELASPSRIYTCEYCEGIILCSNCYKSLQGKCPLCRRPLIEFYKSSKFKRGLPGSKF